MSHTLNRHVGNAVIRKRVEKWRTKSWFLLHRNAPAHWSVSVKDILAKNNVATVEHPSYSPEKVPVDLYLFPPMKLALKRQRFCNNNEIIKHATERLKRLSRNGFQKCFQHLYSHWQKCIAAQGDYFERNECTVLYFSEIKWFREHVEAATCGNLNDYGE